MLQSVMLLTIGKGAIVGAGSIVTKESRHIKCGQEPPQSIYVLLKNNWTQQKIQCRNKGLSYDAKKKATVLGVAHFQTNIDTFLKEIMFEKVAKDLVEDIKQNSNTL